MVAIVRVEVVRYARPAAALLAVTAAAPAVVVAAAALAAVGFTATAPEALVLVAASVVVAAAVATPTPTIPAVVVVGDRKGSTVSTVRSYPSDCPMTESVSSSVRMSVDEAKRPREIEV